jgi:hypothetical protein
MTPAFAKNLMPTNPLRRCTNKSKTPCNSPPMPERRTMRTKYSPMHSISFNVPKCFVTPAMPGSANLTYRQDLAKLQDSLLGSRQRITRGSNNWTRDRLPRPRHSQQCPRSLYHRDGRSICQPCECNRRRLFHDGRSNGHKQDATRPNDHHEP